MYNELNVDIKVIKQRKSQYGDNFECIANSWNNELISLKKTTAFQPKLAPKDVAKMMALMKQCRIDAICDKIGNGEFDNAIGFNELNKSLNDSITDLANYKWIADNWEQYRKL